MRAKSIAALTLAALVAGCSGEKTLGPGSGGGVPTQFAQSITLPEFEGILGTGPARVEIKLVNGSLVAREIEVKEAEEMQTREKIESRVAAIDPGGSVTLELGGLVIGFDGATQFEAEDGEHLTMQAFITRVQDALAAGRNPPVDARRAPADAPQAPGDATFLAGRLELDDEADDDKIEINIGDANLAVSQTPPPDAVLTVLNLPIEIDVTGGRTRLESETHDDRQRVEFDGIVVAVGASSVTLMDGTVIQILDDTEIDDADDDDELGSLAAVEQALAAGLIVEAEGKGVVVAGTDVRTIAASEIEFEVEGNDDDLPGRLEFDGAVASVDVGARSLTLANGTMVHVADDGLIDTQGDLLTLQAAADAVAGGQNVRAEGHAELEDVGPPRVVNALGIKIEVDG